MTVTGFFLYNPVTKRWYHDEGDWVDSWYDAEEFQTPAQARAVAASEGATAVVLAQIRGA